MPAILTRKNRLYMPIFTETLPLSLYIHIPWCVRKCPYCDFNSHQAKGALPEKHYVDALLQELDAHLPLVSGRTLSSIFFGGGTPSLFSGQAIASLLDGVATRFNLSSEIEITLEANPGTIDQARFQAFRKAGINRLSLGIQSLQEDKLKILGRIHDKQQALLAINSAKEAGFTNFNLDMMYGLPNQSLEDALQDIETALSFQPTHFSWYQLTIEPNTLFYHHTPTLPPDDTIWEMQLAGQAMLKKAGFDQYEVSAYAHSQQECLHNRNYWEFGDYLGIGAGAHSKITNTQEASVVRFSQVKHPKEYLDVSKPLPSFKILLEKDLIFEFMLNALRLTKGIKSELFFKRTGIALPQIKHLLGEAKKRGLLEENESHIRPSELGKKFLNDLTAMFL